MNNLAKTDASVLPQKSSSPIICRRESLLTLTETKYHQSEITRLWKTHRNESDHIFFNGTKFTLYKFSQQLAR